jgi:hypothetical protein
MPKSRVTDDNVLNLSQEEEMKKTNVFNMVLLPIVVAVCGGQVATFTQAPT